jgi:N-acetylmuramoyl-L-alanine amidase
MQVFFLFGILTALLSSFFGLNENKALAAARHGKSPYVVVIDAGHGGDDFGTSVKEGKTRVTEKAICLGIAIRTARVLENPDYSAPLGRPIKVILTRKKDKEVSLDRRSEIARKAKADLFLSIHANSDPSKQARGLETYFLNNTDSSSSAKLEQIENKASHRSRSKAADLLLRSIAADAVVNASHQAAETLHNSLLDELRSRDIDVTDRGVRQGMFYVLLDSQVPAVLLEAFFLSDPKDRAFVEQADNRQKIAEGIAKGVLRFLAVR